MSKTINLPEGYVQVTDVTLRDGAQTKGVNFSTRQRVDIAHILTNAGVDIIEGGFPVEKPDQTESLVRISREVDVPYLMALARMNPEEIRKTWDSIKDARNPVIHTWVGTSPTHRQKVKKGAGISRNDLCSWIRDTVSYARDLVGDKGFVQWSPEDAFRTELDYLVEVISIAIESGANFINVPDTVGYAVPEEVNRVFRHLYKTVPGIENVIVKFHPHNDLGNALENIFVAFSAGVRAIEGTINGLGERTGNVDLIQVLGRLHIRSEYYNLRTGFKVKELGPLAKLISAYSGKPIPHNSPIVGECANHHESGVHRSGAMRVKESYEIMNRSDFGLDQIASEQDSLGPMSGRSNVVDLARKIGYIDLTAPEIQKLYDLSMGLLRIEGKRAVDADELRALIEGYVRADKGVYQIAYWNLNSGSNKPAEVNLQLSVKGELTKVQTATGDGPIDATKKAILQLTGIELDVVDLGLDVIGQTGGSGRMGKAWMVLRSNGDIYRTLGVSTNVDEAFAIAYVNGLNRKAEAIANEKP